MGFMSREIRLQVPAKLLPFLEVHKTFKVAHGGRGSAKSHSIAQMLLLKASTRKHRILCVREVQKSLKESSYQLLVDYIDKWGVRGEWDITDKFLRHRRTGSLFTFVGLKDHTADSIKSFEGYDIVWAEEAHSIGAESWNKLIPTIIRTPGAEIWISFNPDDEADYVYARFVKGDDPDALVIEMNWRDNPWWDAQMDKERLRDKAINTDLYNHKWEGHCRTLAGKLFKRQWLKWYLPDELPEQLRIYAGSDYATANEDGSIDLKADHTEHGIFGLDNGGNLYVRNWWYGQDDPEVYTHAMIGLIAKHKPLIWFREKGVILRAIGPAMRKRLRELQANTTYFKDINSAGSKADRALGFAARCAAGTVYLPLDQHGNKLPWAERLENQLAGFTGQHGRQDDAVDVCSILSRGLDLMANAPEAPEAKDRAVKVGSRAHVEPLYAEEDRRRQQRANYYR